MASAPPKKPKPRRVKRHFPRVPTMEECADDDFACQRLAQAQKSREFLMYDARVRILQEKMVRCRRQHITNTAVYCNDLAKEYLELISKWNYVNFDFFKKKDQFKRHMEDIY